jgi:clan AA aspartic protease (TIGR02281 family)
MSFRNQAAILWLSGTLSVIHLACSSNSHQSVVSVAVSPTPVVAVSAEDVATIPKNTTPSAKKIYERAMDVAYSAEFLSESAVSVEDWQLSLSRWQEAIALLRQIPTNSPLYAMAKPKIAEYQRNLSAAKQKPPRPRPEKPSGIILSATPDASTPEKNNDEASTPEAPKPTAKTAIKTPTNQGIFKVPIKRRSGQTPVVDVTFNNGQVFEMIVDTGASGTVITPEMAQSLGLNPEGEVTANTASDKDVKFSTTTVESITVAGAVAKKVRVAIGGEDLEIGLLGQDFFGKYDVLIRQDVVEFHQR